MRQTKALGVDGVLRTRAAERELNRTFAVAFNSPAGEQVLAYLRSITVNVTLGPAATDAALRHQEGMRNLAAIIEQRIENGRHGKPTDHDRPEGDGAGG